MLPSSALRDLNWEGNVVEKVLRNGTIKEMKLKNQNTGNKVTKYWRGRD